MNKPVTVLTGFFWPEGKSVFMYHIAIAIDVF